MSHPATAVPTLIDSNCDTIDDGADGNLQDMSEFDYDGFTANPGLDAAAGPPLAARVAMTPIGDRLLDTAAQQELRGALRAALTEHMATAVSGSSPSNAVECRTLWRVLSTLLTGAGVGNDLENGRRQRLWDTLSVAAQELGRVAVDVPFLTSAVTAATVTRCAAQRPLTTLLVRGLTTAAFLTPFEQPFRVSSAGSFHDGKVWASVPAVAGANDADMMLILCGDKLIGVESAWVQLTPAESLDVTRTLVDVTISGAHGVVLAEGDRALSAVATAAEAASAMLAVEQASLAGTCVQAVSRHAGPDAAEQLQAGADKADWAARYAVQCMAVDDPHTGEAVATARMVCSTVSVRAAHAALQSSNSRGRATALLAERARGSARAFGGPQWQRRRLAQLLTSPLSVDTPLSRRIR